MTWHQMPAVWRLDNLQPLEKLILLSLCHHADARGFNAYPSQERIATHCCTTTRTVRRVLRSLLDKKLIARHGHASSGVVRYRILLPISSSTGTKPKRQMTYEAGLPRPTIQHNPINKNYDYDGGSKVQIDRFSDVEIAPEPGWKAAQRSQRQRQR
jgi:hypothetical protein